MLKRIQKNAWPYLLLSAMTGIVELGSILIAVKVFSSVTVGLGSALCYQSTSFLVKKFPFLGRISTFWSIIGSICIVLSYKSPIVFLSGVLFTSLGLHALRRREKENAPHISTIMKRTTRVVGFMLSGIAATWIIAVVSIIVMGISVFVRRGSSGKERKTGEADINFSWLGLTMFVHQIHYFVYCYALLILLSRMLPSEYLWISGGLFSVGWFSYLISETILKRFNLVWVFVAGHCSLFLLLIGLGLCKNLTLAPVLVIWFLTGIGGGTVFCLKRVGKKVQCPNLGLWEDLGHVAGVLICASLFFIRERLDLSFIFGGAAALVTACLFLLNYPNWKLSKEKI